jgi:hypothetical protein
MRNTKIALLGVIGFVFSSCTTSLHPLFTDGDRTYEPALVGVWQDKDKQATFTLRWFADGKLYSLHTEMTDQPAAPGEFNAVLGRVGKHRFLEIIPRRPSNIGAKGFYGGHFLQLFSFWKVELDGDALTLTPLNYQWVEGMAKAKKLDIRCEQQEGGSIILAASTEELKAFVLKYSEDRAAFSDGLKLQRKK